MTKMYRSKQTNTVMLIVHRLMVMSISWHVRISVTSTFVALFGAVISASDQTQFTCRNSSIWQLNESTQESLRKVIDIFEMSNVVVYPNDLYSEVTIGVRRLSNSAPQEMESALTSCIGKHNSREAARAVFFNCPCATDGEPFTSLVNRDSNKYCPAHAKWISELRTTDIANTSTDKPFLPTRRQKDLLVVFNSWGSTSLYHTLFDVVFPVWTTVHRAVTIGGYQSSSLTLINTSPQCPPHEIHLTTVQPWFELLYGPGVYELTSGNVSKSFGATDGSVTGTEAGGGTLYRHAVFGFSYLWRPLYDVSYGRFDASLGRLLVTFAHELRMKMFQKVQTSGLQGAESLQLNLYSDVHSYARNSSDSSARDKDSSQWRVHQGAAMQRSKDDGRRVDAASLSDHILRALTPANAGATMSVIDFGSTPLDTLPKQAAAASKLSLLVGTEGAGFSQQLFMPPRSVLVIIHCPRPRRKNGGKSFLDAVVQPWHGAVAQYLGHSVLNILPPICAEITTEQFRRIANSVSEVIKLHKEAIKKNMTVDASHDVRNSFFQRMESKMVSLL